MNFLIFFLILLNCSFAFTSLDSECNFCECKPIKDIPTCICEPRDDATECNRDSHKLLISGHKFLIPNKYSLKIIQSMVVKNININKLMVSFTNEMLPNLYHLKFDNCNLTQIDKDAFFNVQNITHLILKNNPELHLKSDSFHYVQNLIYLDLENNNLNDFPVNIFVKSVKLKELYLDYNHLENISKVILQPLFNLLKIQIRQNQIQFIKEDLFESNINLEMIILNGNQIEFLNRTFVQHLNKLQYLYLDNNPLNCNCSLRDFYDEYKMRNFTITGECKNNNFGFAKLERKHFDCPAKLINITKIQKNYSFNLSCTIESDGKPNALWLSENNSSMGTKHNDSFIIIQSKIYYLNLNLEVDPLKYYENNLTCFLINKNSNETMHLPITYSPKIIQINKVEEFGFKNDSNKIILTHNFTVTNENEFNMTWIIKVAEIDKNIDLIFNICNLKPNKYSTDLILNNFVENFTGKCTLFIADESSKIIISKSFNEMNDINMTMTELLFLLRYKNKHFYNIEGNNSVCSFVHKTELVNSKPCQNYQYKCNFNTYKVSELKLNILFVLALLFIALFVIFLIYCICCKKMCVSKQHNKEVTNNSEDLISKSKENSSLIEKTQGKLNDESIPQNNLNESISIGHIIRFSTTESLPTNRNSTNDMNETDLSVASEKMPINSTSLSSSDEGINQYQDSRKSSESQEFQKNPSPPTSEYLLTEKNENNSSTPDLNVYFETKEMGIPLLPINVKEENCPNKEQDFMEFSSSQDLKMNDTSSMGSINIIEKNDTIQLNSSVKEINYSSSSSSNLISGVKSRKLSYTSQGYTTNISSVRRTSHEMYNFTSVHSSKSESSEFFLK